MIKPPHTISGGASPDVPEVPKMSWDDMTREEEDATRQLISLEDEGIKSRKFDQGWFQSGLCQSMI